MQMMRRGVLSAVGTAAVGAQALGWSVIMTSTDALPEGGSTTALTVTAGTVVDYSNSGVAIGFYSEELFDEQGQSLGFDSGYELYDTYLSLGTTGPGGPAGQARFSFVTDGPTLPDAPGPVGTLAPTSGFAAASNAVEWIAYYNDLPAAEAAGGFGNLPQLQAQSNSLFSGQDAVYLGRITTTGHASGLSGEIVAVLGDGAGYVLAVQAYDPMETALQAAVVSTPVTLSDGSSPATTHDLYVVGTPVVPPAAPLGVAEVEEMLQGMVETSSGPLAPDSTALLRLIVSIPCSEFAGLKSAVYTTAVAASASCCVLPTPGVCTDADALFDVALDGFCFFPIPGCIVSGCDVEGGEIGCAVSIDAAACIFAISQGDDCLSDPNGTYDFVIEISSELNRQASQSCSFRPDPNGPSVTCCLTSGGGTGGVELRFCDPAGGEQLVDAQQGVSVDTRLGLPVEPLPPGAPVNATISGTFDGFVPAGVRSNGCVGRAFVYNELSGVIDARGGIFSFPTSNAFVSFGDGFDSNGNLTIGGITSSITSLTANIFTITGCEEEVDADGNGRFNELDVAFVQNLASNPIIVTPAQLDRFDFDDNGVIDQADVDVLQHLAASGFSAGVFGDPNGDGLFDCLDEAVVLSLPALPTVFTDADYVIELDSDLDGMVTQSEVDQALLMIDRCCNFAAPSEVCDSFDLSVFFGLIATGDPAADQNGDGFVDAFDIALVLNTVAAFAL